MSLHLAIFASFTKEMSLYLLHRLSSSENEGRSGCLILVLSLSVLKLLSKATRQKRPQSPDGENEVDRGSFEKYFSN